jgi:hypothetical protein
LGLCGGAHLRLAGAGSFVESPRPRADSIARLDHGNLQELELINK